MIVLQANPSPTDTQWSFRVDSKHLSSHRPRFGKLVTFTHEAIKLQMAEYPQNRILHLDDPSKFILASFGSLRFPDTKLSVTADYLNKLFEAGFFLNGVQYRFYHHSNSQLVSIYQTLVT